MSLSYNKGMDDRKRAIADLESKKKETLRSLEAMYEDFGAALFNRAGGQEARLGESAEEYLRLQKEIADSQGLIQLTEADTRRFKELEQEILGKEREHTALLEEIQNACTDVGRDAAGDEAFVTPLGELQLQIDQVIPKLEDARNKLDELEGRGGAGVFGWIGKSAQGAVYRTLAVKHQGSLKKLYTSAGERLAGPENESFIAGSAIEDAVRAVRDMKKQALAQGQELERLREERRRLGTVFGAEGGPVRRVQNLEKHIAHIRLELKLVYRRAGGEALSESRDSRFAGVLGPEDQRVVEMAGQNKAAIAGYDREIEKLKTAIAIDGEKAGIEKMKRSIEEQRQKIGAAEGRIGDLETQIREAEARIEELSKLV
jgi:chromosome segregation ATPase